MIRVQSLAVASRLVPSRDLPPQGKACCLHLSHFFFKKAASKARRILGFENGAMKEGVAAAAFYEEVTVCMALARCSTLPEATPAMEMRPSLVR